MNDKGNNNIEIFEDIEEYVDVLKKLYFMVIEKANENEGRNIIQLNDEILNGEGMVTENELISFFVGLSIDKKDEIIKLLQEIKVAFLCLYKKYKIITINEGVFKFGYFLVFDTTQLDPVFAFRFVKHKDGSLNPFFDSDDTFNNIFLNELFENFTTEELNESVAEKLIYMAIDKNIIYLLDIFFYKIVEYDLMCGE